LWALSILAQNDRRQIPGYCSGSLKQAASRQSWVGVGWLFLCAMVAEQFNPLTEAL